MRLFLAMDLAPEIRASLAALLDELRPTTDAVRWVKPEGLHVTLKFLGETPEPKLPEISAGLAPVKSTRPVEMSFRGLGFFPSERQPRVFWVGIEATPNLAELAEEIEQKLAALGFARENRPFHPHLTLGRYRSLDRRRRLQERIRDLGRREFGRQSISEFFLFQSQLGRGGAEYKKLARFELVRR